RNVGRVHQLRLAWARRPARPRDRELRLQPGPVLRAPSVRRAAGLDGAAPGPYELRRLRPERRRPSDTWPLPGPAGLRVSRLRGGTALVTWRRDGRNPGRTHHGRSAGVLGLLLLLAGCSGGSTPAPVFGGRSVQEDQAWPQELMGGDGSTVLLYQPQVESWKDYQLLRARMAVAFRRTGTPSPVLGAVVLEGDTATSIEQDKVRISNIRIVSGHFPALTPGESERLLNALRS